MSPASARMAITCWTAWWPLPMWATGSGPNRRMADLAHHRTAGGRASAGDDNLVLRAARLLPGVAARITLHKVLPVASGIGGGSADAAATLRALARPVRFLPLPTPQAVLRPWRRCAGLPARTPCRMTGVGEGLPPGPSAAAGGRGAGQSRRRRGHTGGLCGAHRRDNPPMPADLPPLPMLRHWWPSWPDAQRSGTCGDPSRPGHRPGVGPRWPHNRAARWPACRGRVQPVSACSRTRPDPGHHVGREIVEHVAQRVVRQRASAARPAPPRPRHRPGPLPSRRAGP
jgi:hypothetical protein